MRQKTKNPLRCFCSRHPILAFYGIDDNDQPYVHIKVYKSHRIFGEVIVTKGEVFIHCRECLRWQRLIVVPRPTLEVSDPPSGTVEPDDRP